MQAPSKPNKHIIIIMAVLMLTTLLVPFLADRQKLAWEAKHRMRVVLDIGNASADTQLRVMTIELARLRAMGLRNVISTPEGAGRLELIVPGVEDAQHLRDFLTASGSLEIRLLPVNVCAHVDAATGAATFTHGGQPMAAAQVLAAAEPLLTGSSVQVGRRIPTDKRGCSVFSYAAATSDARTTFANLTKDFVGRDLLFSTDGRIITTQTITSMILTGTFTRKFDDPREVGVQAVLLSNGALPVPVRVTECGAY